jgi:hypothetical protein
MAATCRNHRLYQPGCSGCQEQSAAYFRRRYRSVAYGTWQHLTSPAAALDYIAGLRRQGMTVRQISIAARVAVTTLSQMPIRKTITRDTERRILAVTPDAAPLVRAAKDRVDATGTTRRLQALACKSWSTVDIAERIDLHRQTVRRLMLGLKPRIAAFSAERFRALYDEMWEHTGPSLYASKEAVERGWSPPGAWDDDTIDDPAVKPQLPRDRDDGYDEAKVIQACNRVLVYDQLRPAERAEAVRRLNAAGKNDQEIAEVLGSSNNTIGKRRMTMGLPSRFDPASYLGRAS